MNSNVALPQLAGTAAGTVTSGSPINGMLAGLYVASNSEGTVTISQTVPPVTIMNLTGGAGTSWYYPRPQACDVGGTAVAGMYDAIPLDGYVRVACNAGGTIDVTLALVR